MMRSRRRNRAGSVSNRKFAVTSAARKAEFTVHCLVADPTLLVSRLIGQTDLNSNQIISLRPNTQAILWTSEVLSGWSEGRSVGLNSTSAPLSSPENTYVIPPGTVSRASKGSTISSCA